MIAKLKSEPVVVALIGRLVLYAGVKFGLHVTVDDLFNLLIALEAVSAAVTRMHVTPNSKVPPPDPDKTPAETPSAKARS